MMSLCEQVSLCSGDGFSVSLPAHFLLAASKLARNTFVPSLTGQAVFLPSVRGSTLLLVVGILRSGKTSCLRLMQNVGCRLKEAQEVMELLGIPGCAAVMMVNCVAGSVQDIHNCGERSEIRNLETIEIDPTCLTPIEVLEPLRSPTSSNR